MPPKKQQYLCLQCNGKIEKQICASCSICDRWIHKDCFDDEETYKLIDKVFKKHGKHFWSCDVCSLGLSKLHKLVMANEREIENLKEDMSELKIVSNEHADKLKTTSEKLETLTSEVDELKSRTSENGMNDDILNEIDLREAKKNNLVFFNIPERGQELPAAERKRDDETEILALCEELGQKLELKTDVKFVARVGEWQQGKVRPITIGLKNTVIRDQLLQGAWKLARSVNYRKVSVTPDLTKKQVARENELMREAAEKNSQLSSEESKNYHWKLVGVRGCRQLRKVRKPGQPRPTRDRLGSVRRTREEMEEEEEIEPDLTEAQRMKRRC